MILVVFMNKECIVNRLNDLSFHKSIMDLDVCFDIEELEEILKLFH